ncbi:MAG TPA: M56 family metallopeptidase [Streptosporangiaceae bacterium]|jgi:hypothetical protein
MMLVTGLFPIGVSVLLALGVGSLGRRLPPAAAAPLLTLLALATSLATGLVLCLAAFSALARLPLVASAGGWSLATWRPLDQLPAAIGLAAGGVAAILLAAAVAQLAVTTRQLVLAALACRQLASSHDRLVITGDQRPTAYTVPALPGAIVVSAGMLRLLSAGERRALLAHEAAHLRHRHAAYVLLSRLAAAANPLLRPLASSVRLAVELWADQSAADEVGDSRLVARAIARASLAVSDHRPPGGVALAIGESDVAVRVRALLDRRVRPGRSRTAAAAAVALTLASGLTAGTLALAVHARVEMAQVKYEQAHGRQLAGPSGQDQPSPGQGRTT